MTWCDVVRKYFKDATDKECHFILWEKTAFPCARAEFIEAQIKELAESRALK
jgi:hypothetical protein